MTNVEELPGGLRTVDTMTAGMTKVTAGYILDAPRPTLIECGPALSIDNVIDGLHEVGMDAEDLAYLVLSHIHLDHAAWGGRHRQGLPVRDGGRQRDRGAAPGRPGAAQRQLPTRLRRPDGLRVRRLHPDRPGARPRCRRRRAPGPRRRTRPGSAPHPGPCQASHRRVRSRLRSPVRRGLRRGEDAGDDHHPARDPAPDFDLVLADRTLQRYRDLQPSVVYLAHYGAVDPPQEALAEAAERLHLWADTAEAAYAEHDDLEHITETLGRRFADEVAADPADPDAEARVALLSGFESNAMGLLRYFTLRDEGRTAR